MNIQFAEDLFYLGVKIPGVQFIHLYNCITQLVYILFFTIQFKLFNSVDDGVIMAENIIKDRPIFPERWFLLEKSNLYIFMDPDSTFFGSFFPRHYLHQGRLATTISCDQCDLVALLNVK